MKSPFMKNPWVILVSIVLGVLFGLFAKETALFLAPIGDIYLYLIQMTVLPILITAVISSLALIIRSPEAQKYLTRMLLVFLSALLLMSIAGAVTGMIGQPGHGLDRSTQKTLSEVINKNGEQGVLKMRLNDPSGPSTESKPSFLNFLEKLVPSNIFNALGLGNALEVVFFAILFGIVLGFIQDQNSQLIIRLSQNFLAAFQKLISWALYGLPVGLIFLISAQVAHVGVAIFLAMLKFIGLFYAGGAVMFLVSVAVIWVRSGKRNPLDVFKALLEPMIIALATRNSFAALPASIESLENKLGFDPVVSNLVLSLGTTVLRFGNIFYFALAAFFVAQIYGSPIGLSEFLIIVVGSVLAGTATAGSSGLLTLPVLGFVLAPLSLPLEAVLVIFMAIDTIIDPMRTLLIVMVNMATTALVAPRAKANEI